MGFVNILKEIFFGKYEMRQDLWLRVVSYFLR